MAIDPATANGLGTSDDHALLQRIADRRPEALAELYDRYASLLLAVTRRLLPSPTDAEEALQATFFEVWQRAGRFDAGHSSVSAWLVLLARDRALERLARARHRGAASGTGEANVETLPGVVVERAAVGERRERVRTALAAIPSEERELLAAAFFEGLTTQELAERRRLPLATVRRQLARSMMRLRRDLRGEIRELM